MRTRGLAAILLIALTLAARADAAERVWRIGVLSSRQRPEPLDSSPLYRRFIARMTELGYVQGRNLSIDWEFAAGDYRRLQELAARLVSSRVDAILTNGSEGIRAAQEATSKIPIVFIGGSDVVASGFVKSLGRPGGNSTGFTFLQNDVSRKQVELLGRMRPGLSRIAVLLNSGNPSYGQIRKIYSDAATASSVTIELLGVDTGVPGGIERALASVAGKAQALIWAMDAYYLDHQRVIADLALKYRLPSVGGDGEYAELGGLMGYGTDRAALWGLMAEYVDRIFKGADPGELPVQQPVRFDLAINRRTAAALGLTIPPELLVQADRVIE